jgi:hypothetical protein
MVGAMIGDMVVVQVLKWGSSSSLCQKNDGKENPIQVTQNVVKEMEK